MTKWNLNLQCVFVQWIHSFIMAISSLGDLFLSSSTARLPWLSTRPVSLYGFCRLCWCVGPLWWTKPVSHWLRWGELYSHFWLFGLGLDLPKPHVHPHRAALQRPERLHGQLWRRGLWWDRWAGWMLCYRSLSVWSMCWQYVTLCQKIEDTSRWPPTDGKGRETIELKVKCRLSVLIQVCVVRIVYSVLTGHVCLLKRGVMVRSTAQMVATSP